MKTKISIAVFCVLAMLGLPSAAIAATTSTTFTVSATVLAATGVTIAASRVNSSNNQFTAVAGTGLSFNPLTYSAANGIYLPDHYFALDVGTTGGVGTPDVTVIYTEGANPNNPAHGLGWKATATFVKVTGPINAQIETGIASHGPKKLLKSLSGESITKAQISGGFLRIYLGIVSKDLTAIFPDPADAELFTNVDAAGAYNGTLFVSATVL